MITRASVGPSVLIALLVGGLAAPARAETSTRDPIGGFSQYSGQVVPLPVGQRPYDSDAVTPVGGFGLVDDTGVRMASVGGQVYNHPVAQGAYVLANLNSYRLTGNTAYLQIAELNGQRLIDTRVESDGAWYFPYSFNWVVAGDPTEALIAPWFSGMAQGRSLSVFSRLYQATSDPKWKAAADATFLSLQQAPSGTAPYAVHVDANQRLWLEEYPRYPVDNSEEVLNGHIFALFGLLDYWQLTGDSTALALIRGAISTVQQTAMSGFRRVNAASVYSLRHHKPAYHYHQIHVGQMLQLLSYTQDPRFAAIATAYRSDYPRTDVSGTMQATPRTSTIYRLDDTGQIIGSKRVHFAAATTAPLNARQRIFGGPVALRVAKGPYKDWYFPEVHGVTWALGATDTHTYVPQIRVYLEIGTYSAYKLDTRGRVIGSKTVRFTHRSSAPTTMSAIVQGRPAFSFSTGTYAGYWLPMQKGAHL